jgi:predicted metal-dependent peptidase
MNVSDETLQRFQAARAWVALERPYFSSALWGLRIVFAESVPTMGVDMRGRLYVSPAFVDGVWAKAGGGAAASAQLGAVLVHEVMHVLRDHGARAAAIGAQPDAWNLASDAEINDDLRRDGLPLPGGAVVPETLGAMPDGLAEAYYASLLATHGPGGAGGAPDAQGARSDESTQPACGSGSGGERGSWELDGDDEVRGLTPGQLDSVRRMVAQDVVRHEREHGRGSVPSNLVRWAEALVAPRVSWQQELAASLRGRLSLLGGKVEWSFLRPSRRQEAADGFFLPGMVGRQVRVGVVVDTSGSMGTDELGQACSELVGILRVAGAETWVVACDARATEPRRLVRIDDLELVGGGGTDLREGFGALEPIRPDVVVVLTDGLTPWPDDAPDADVIVVVFGDDSKGVPEWAHSISVPIGG